MKVFLTAILLVSSMSSFALTTKQAKKIVKASRSGRVSDIEVKSSNKNEVELTYSIKGGVVCSSVVKESRNPENPELKVITILDGYCFQ